MSQQIRFMVAQENSILSIGKYLWLCGLSLYPKGKTRSTSPIFFTGTLTMQCRVDLGKPISIDQERIQVLATLVLSSMAVDWERRHVHRLARYLRRRISQTWGCTTTHFACTLANHSLAWHRRVSASFSRNICLSRIPEASTSLAAPSQDSSYGQ